MNLVNKKKNRVHKKTNFLELIQYKYMNSSATNGLNAKQLLNEIN
jgi:hypothetical protein